MANFGDGGSVRREGQSLLRAQQCLAAMASYLSSQVTDLVPASWNGHGADTFAAGWSGQSQLVSQLSAVCGHVGQTLVDLGKRNRHPGRGIQLPGTAGGASRRHQDRDAQWQQVGGSHN